MAEAAALKEAALANPGSTSRSSAPGTYMNGDTVTSAAGYGDPNNKEQTFAMLVNRQASTFAKHFKGIQGSPDVKEKVDLRTQLQRNAKAKFDAMFANNKDRYVHVPSYKPFPCK